MFVFFNRIFHEILHETCYALKSSENAQSNFKSIATRIKKNLARKLKFKMFQYIVAISSRGISS